MNNQIVENKTKRMAWSDKENSELLANVKNRGNKSMTEVFNEFAQKYNRQPSSITQHYYLLSKNTVKETPKQNSQTQKSTKKNVALKATSPTVTKKTGTKDNTTDVNLLIKKIRKMPNKAIHSLSYIVNNMNVQ